MGAVKIACLGGGSLYFPRALGDLVLRDDLAGSEIAIYDIDAEKAQLMVVLGRRLAHQAGANLTIRVASGLEDAVDGAQYAISSIGGSGAEISTRVYQSYYHSADMHIPAKYGIQQIVGDTAGPAGMMMGLRSVPAYIAICREMEQRCPEAILLNHSNPMAVLCRAMDKYTGIKVIGICHGVQATIREAAEMLDLRPDQLECTWIGTNHYYWILRAAHKGQDLTARLADVFSDLGRRGSSHLAHRLSKLYGYKVGYPGAGHLVEFYSWATRAQKQGDLPYDLAEDAKSHGFDANASELAHQTPSAEVKASFFRQYQAILDKTKLPDAATPGSASEEGVARMIAAIENGRREVFIVNVANKGAILNLPREASVEIEGVTDSSGVRGITVGECPAVLKAILEKRFAWQELVADAAVTGDRSLALQALMLDEMAIHPDQAEDMLEELLLASKDLLPQFFGNSRA